MSIGLIWPFLFALVIAERFLLPRDDLQYANYPECSRDLCFDPMYESNNTCMQQGTSCTCQSAETFGLQASCVGTVCPGDLDAVFAKVQSDCSINGYTSPPLAPAAFTASASIPWTIRIAGVFTGPPSNPTPLADPSQASIYPECTRILCAVPHLYYDNHQSNEAACSANPLEIFASCVGRLCPDEVNAAYSAAQGACGFTDPIALSLDQWVQMSEKDPLSVYNSVMNPAASKISPTSTLNFLQKMHIQCIS